jgi:hypothetical protein
MALGAWPLIPCAENLETKMDRYAIQWLEFGVQGDFVAWSGGETSSMALAGCWQSARLTLLIGRSLGLDIWNWQSEGKKLYLGRWNSHFP